MAVKQKKKNKPVRLGISFSTLKKPKTIAALVILLAILGLGVSRAVHTYQANNEKQDFLSKQQMLESIADKISAQNKPDQRNSFEFCRYQSGKYQKGDIYCSVEIDLLFENIDFDSANRIKDVTSQLFAPEKLSNPLNPNEVSFSETKSPPINTIFQKIPEQSKFNCGITYLYPYPLDNDNNLRIDFYCTKKSNAEHFELQK